MVASGGGKQGKNKWGWQFCYAKAKIEHPTLDIFCDRKYRKGGGDTWCQILQFVRGQDVKIGEAGDFAYKTEN